jgi:hypothetical protein
VREGRRLGPLDVSRLVSLLRLWCLLVLLHSDHDLLHGLEHLILHHQNLLHGRWGWWVSNIVVFTVVVVSVGIAVPSVGHLKNRV